MYINFIAVFLSESERDTSRNGLLKRQPLRLQDLKQCKAKADNLDNQSSVRSQTRAVLDIHSECYCMPESTVTSW